MAAGIFRVAVQTIMPSAAAEDHGKHAQIRDTQPEETGKVVMFSAILIFMGTSLNSST